MILTMMNHFMTEFILKVINKAAKLWCKDKNLKFRVVELKDFGYFWLRKSLQKHKEILDGKT